MEHLEDQIDNISIDSRDILKDNSDSNSEPENGISLTVEFVVNECLDFIQIILRALSFLTDVNEELSTKNLDKETNDQFTEVFKDIKPLYELYTLIIFKITNQKSLGTFCLPSVFLEDDIRSQLNIYKHFLSNYSNNAKWISSVTKEKELYTEIGENIRKRKEIQEIITLDSCFYTIFNSPFVFSMFLHRFNKCFVEGHELRKKGEEVETIIADLLNDININQKQMFLAQKELSLLTGKSKDMKINARFIYKGTAFCLNKKDDKVYRTLVLFSHCIYVASMPGNIIGTCKVKEELSINGLIVTKTTGNESKGIKFHWGLNFNAQEGDFDFYFEDEDIMTIWKSKLDELCRLSKSEIPEMVCELNIGETAPRWQRDRSAGYCNGYGCCQRFTPVTRRHHCRSDGLLYCDSCCSYRLKLKFMKGSESSRVCELCYRILCKDTQDLISLNDAKKKLKAVIDLKTRKNAKSGWLEERMYNSDKSSFNPPVKYFCELDLEHPYLNLYEKYEDKRNHHGIMLVGMNVKAKCHSRYYGKLKPHQFVIEHQDKNEAYLFKAGSAEYCEKWVDYLNESIRNFFNS